MNVLWEAMIGEMRAQRLEFDNQRHFTKEDHPIVDSRAFIDDLLTPEPPVDPEVISAKTAMSFRDAQDELEVG